MSKKMIKYAFFLLEERLETNILQYNIYGKTLVIKTDFNVQLKSMVRMIAVTM